MPYPPPTSGLLHATQIAVDAAAVTLSLSGTTTHQITPNVENIAGTVQAGTALTLTAAAAASAGVTAYTGTITGGGSNALLGEVFVVAGFDLAANNGTFVCTASTATTLTLDNAAGVVDTHAATATPEGPAAVTYVSRNPNIATVSNTGLITAVKQGQADVEVSYPAFGNTLAKANDGTPLNKLYKTVLVQVNR